MTPRENFPGGQLYCAMAVGIGVIGAGQWGANHIRNLAGLPGARLSWVIDPDGARLAEVAARFPGPRTAASIDPLLADADTAAVVIATPAGTHFETARKCLTAGKHVLIEKPFARSVAEARELISLAGSKKRILIAGHTFLYNAAVRWAHDAVARGELGDVLHVYAKRLSLGQVRSDVDVVWNLAPHDFSILDRLLGTEPVRVSAHCHSFFQKGISDVAFVHLEYPEGRGAHVHVSWCDPQKVRETVIVGTRKMLVYDDVAAEKIRVHDKGIDRAVPPYRDFREFQLILRRGEVTVPKIDFPEPLSVELSHFLDCIESRASPLTGGEHALRILKILEAVDRSRAAGGAPVPVQAV